MCVCIYIYIYIVTVFPGSRDTKLVLDRNADSYVNNSAIFYGYSASMLNK